MQREIIICQGVKIAVPKLGSITDRINDKLEQMRFPGGAGCQLKSIVQIGGSLSRNAYVYYVFLYEFRLMILIANIYKIQLIYSRYL